MCKSHSDSRVESKMERMGEEEKEGDSRLWKKRQGGGGISGVI